MNEFPLPASSASDLSMPKSPRLSVITAAHNAAATLRASIESNLAQDYAGWFEVIVVDDGSSDDTTRVLSSLDHPRLTVIRLPQNHGRAEARNIAAKASQGDFLVPCDADDLSLPGRLSAHARAILAEPHHDVYFGKYWAVDDTGHVRHWPVMPRRSHDVDAEFLRGQMAVAHGASAFRKTWFDSVGGYDASIRIAEDYDLFARGWSRGAYLPHDDFVLEYAIRSYFPAWEYWWDNERFRRAIAARSSADGIGAGTSSDLAPFLDATSTGLRRRVERLRYLLHRSVEPARELLNRRRP